MPRVLLVLTSLLLLAAGCGSAGDEPGVRPAPSSTPPATPAPASSTPTVPATPPVRLPSRPTDVFEKIRVVGTVVGAQDSCVDVDDANGIRWTLLGPEAARLRPGQRVQVTGRSRPETPGCTGIPLVVQQLVVLP